MRLNPFRRRQYKRRRSSSAGWLKPATKKAIVGVVLLLIAIITVFSFFGQAGSIGIVILRMLRLSFGWLAYGAPFLFVYVSYYLLRPNLEPLPRSRVIGVILLTIGLLGTFHLIGIAPDDALQVASEGKGGGFLGFTLSYPLSLALSVVVSIIVFLAALIIGIFMTFNLSPAEAVERLMGLWPETISEDDTDDEEKLDNDEETHTAVSPPRFRIRSMGNAVPKIDPAQLKLDEERAQKEKHQKIMQQKQLKQANRKYVPPPLELLATSTRQPEGGDIETNKDTIKTTLENFNITVTMGKAKVGPTVTQYTFRPDEGIRLSQITALQNDLARALKAHPVRIEAPIPNTDLVGIEIPNKEVASVRLRDLLGSKEMKRAESPLSIGLGRDVSGIAVTAELDRMPHLLIAGATNSGKSVAIHSILMSLLYRNSPAILRLILIDPKRVELTAYNGIPHLWGDPVIVDMAKALNALKWVLRQMDKRYKLLEESGSRNLFSYNVNNPENAMPFIVIVVDELAVLMAKHVRDVEGPVVRLSQQARAVGIHLILATQRPSVNVITGLIKANIPTRIALKVVSQVDSRTILDMAGAEKLVGTGDMLFLASDNARPRRLQGGLVSEEEVSRVVQFIIENNDASDFTDEESITEGESRVIGSSGIIGDDVLLTEAKRVANAAGKVSASLLQRRLKVGYSRAARLLDMLEAAGIIGPADGNKPREVLRREAQDRHEPDQKNSDLSMTDEDSADDDDDNDTEDDNSVINEN